MLKLILGRQKFGKTQKCLEIAEKCALADKKTIMLVPEQYSFQCQRHLLEALGSKISNRIEIHSFTSLCEAICAVNGGLAGFVVDDATRYILVGQAIKNVRDNLLIYGKYVGSTPFIKQIVSVITEFKQSAVSIDALKTMSQTADSVLFSNKLHDIALIISAYDALISNRFVEQFDLIERTLANMQDNSYFNGKTVIVDEFKGFTKSQYLMLQRIISGADDIIVSLCCDSLVDKSETDIFSNVKDSARSLLKYAEDNSISTEIVNLTEEDDFLSNDIKELEKYLSGNSLEVFSEPVKNISVTSAASVYDEIEAVMRTIRKSVREEGMRFKDFVIISRNDSNYSQAIDELSELYNVPCFTDNRVPVMTLPFTVLLLSMVKAAVSFESDDIFRYLKTGLAGFTTNEIALLENYVFIWSINGKKWLNDWDMKTTGLSQKDDGEHLKVVNDLRIRAVEPINRLRKALNGNAAEMCKALYNACEHLSVAESLSRYCWYLEKNGYLQEAEYQKTGYDTVIKALDKIVSVLGEDEISAKDFVEILSNALSYETVGEIPKTLDQVVYGTADRIKPLRPKVVFVVGVNQDVFPAAVSDVGLFTISERDQMRNNSIEVADHSIRDCLDEKFLLYFACTSAFERCYISYCNAGSNGSSMAPSSEINGIIEHFPGMRCTEYINELCDDCLETKELAFRKLAENFSIENDTAEILSAYFSKDEDYSYRFKALMDFQNSTEPKITEESAIKLYGSELNLSASKADDFAGCRFMYFCKYGIGAKTLQRVDFDPLTRGNIVHFCLEHFVNNHFDDIGQLEEDGIYNEISELCDNYISENGGELSQFDDKFRYMIGLIKETVSVLAKALNNEFAVSSFRPSSCELEVGSGKDVEGIKVLTNNGHNVTLSGYIDRVDTTDDGKIRVVDYKTGSKGDDFKLSELLNGQNMQMLLYLYSVLKNGRDLLKASVPAGVLYFPAKRSFSTEKSDYVRMNGIILDDGKTAVQMEPALEGNIIPLKLRKNSDKLTSTEPLITEEAFNILFKYIERMLQDIGNKVLGGDITPLPLKSNDHLKCEYCDYRSVCRFDKNKGFKQTVELKNSAAIEEIIKVLEGEGNGN